VEKWDPKCTGKSAGGHQLTGMLAVVPEQKGKKTPGRNASKQRQKKSKILTMELNRHHPSHSLQAKGDERRRKGRRSVRVGGGGYRTMREQSKLGRVDAFLTVLAKEDSVDGKGRTGWVGDREKTNHQREIPRAYEWGRNIQAGELGGQTLARGRRYGPKLSESWTGSNSPALL